MIENIWDKVKRMFGNIYNRVIKNKSLNVTKIDLISENENIFHTLAPRKRTLIDTYEDSLSRIINDKNDYLNIALTGIYGSGKSSIISSSKTLEEKGFLRISLAKLEKDEETHEGTTFVENRILQQILYQVTKKSLKPKSINEIGNLRISLYLFSLAVFFYCIVDVNKKLVIEYTLSNVLSFLIIVIIFNILFFLFPKIRNTNKIFKEYQKDNIIFKFIYLIPVLLICRFSYVVYCEMILKFVLSQEDSIILVISEIVIIAAFGSFLFFKLIKSIYNYFTIKNVSINYEKLTVEMEQKKDNVLDSLTRYTYTILRVLKLSNKSIIIFEDLDRLNDYRIFQQIKELNFLINKELSSGDKSIKNDLEKKEIKIWCIVKNYLRLFINKNKYVISNPVKFIYVIRDDMLECDDRTKFFDIIMPIVPILNNKNASFYFMKIIDEVKLMNSMKIADYLDLAYCSKVISYVNDMRMLNNIMNEFFIYVDAIMDKGWNPIGVNFNTIFTLMVYKSLYGKDFSDLHKGKGLLYDLIYDLLPEKNYETEAIHEKNDIKKHLVFDIVKKYDQINQIFDLAKNKVNESIDKINSLHILVEFADEKWFFKYHHNSFSYYIYIVALHFKDISGEVKFKIIDKENNKIWGSEIEVPIDVLKSYFEEFKNYYEMFTNVEKKGLVGNIDESEVKRVVKYKINASEKGTKDAKDLNKKRDFMIYILNSGYLNKDSIKYLSYSKNELLDYNDMITIYNILYSENNDNMSNNIFNFHNVAYQLLEDFYLDYPVYELDFINFYLTLNDSRAQRKIELSISDPKEDQKEKFDRLWNNYFNQESLVGFDNLINYIFSNYVNNLEIVKKLFCSKDHDNEKFKSFLKIYNLFDQNIVNKKDFLFLKNYLNYIFSMQSFNDNLKNSLDKIVRLCKFLQYYFEDISSYDEELVTTLFEKASELIKPNFINVNKIFEVYGKYFDYFDEKIMIELLNGINEEFVFDFKDNYEDFFVYKSELLLFLITKNISLEAYKYIILGLKKNISIDENFQNRMWAIIKNKFSQMKEEQIILLLRNEIINLGVMDNSISIKLILKIDNDIVNKTYNKNVNNFLNLNNKNKSAVIIREGIPDQIVIDDDFLVTGVV